MSKKPKLTEAEETQVCIDYLEGATPLELSFKYRIATNTVWYILERNSVKRRNQTTKKG